jgi:hypothetical protein
MNTHFLHDRRKIILIIYALLLIPPSTIIHNNIFFYRIGTYYLKSVTSVIEVLTSVVRS